MSHIDNNINVDVYLSGQNTTSVGTDAGTSNVTVAIGQQDVTINKAAGTSVTIGQAGQEISIGMAGIQGAAGTSITAVGDDGSIQYNRLGMQSGAKTFLFFPTTDRVLLSGGIFTLENSKFRITGTEIETNKFVINDINDPSSNLLTIDPINKKVYLTPSAADNEYYFGIAVENPEERLHVGGNLKVDGDIYLAGDLVPTGSGVSNLGSETKPFKELFLEGESINFVSANAKIKATKQGFNFFIEEQTAAGQVAIRNVMTVLTGIGGSKLAGIAEFADQFKVDGALITGVPYTGLTDAGVFIEQNIPENSSNITVNYGVTLSYTPKVLCSVVPSEGATELYFVHVENITRTNCKAVFSSKVTQSDYRVNCFVSPDQI